MILPCIPIIQLLSNGIKSLTADIEKSTEAQREEGEFKLRPTAPLTSPISGISPLKAHVHIHEGEKGLKASGKTPHPAPPRVPQECLSIVD